MVGALPIHAQAVGPQSGGVPAAVLDRRPTRPSRQGWCAVGRLASGRPAGYRCGRQSPLRRGGGRGGGARCGARSPPNITLAARPVRGGAAGFGAARRLPVRTAKSAPSRAPPPLPVGGGTAPGRSKRAGERGGPRAASARTPRDTAEPARPRRDRATCEAAGRATCTAQQATCEAPKGPSHLRSPLRAKQADARPQAEAICRAQRGHLRP